jgi:hypothetical protein
MIRSEVQEKKDGPEIQKQKKEKMAETIPYKYGNKNSTTNLPQITIKCTDADGKENKEECPIFMNGTQNKILIQTIEMTVVLGNHYNWKEVGKKAKKMAKEEKETKKKVSIKSGDCHIMQKTPFVQVE